MSQVRLTVLFTIVPDPDEPLHDVLDEVGVRVGSIVEDYGTLTSPVLVEVDGQEMGGSDVVSPGRILDDLIASLPAPRGTETVVSPALNDPGISLDTDPFELIRKKRDAI